MELKQLSAYFPYKVKAKFKCVNKQNCDEYEIGEVGAIYNDGTIVCYDTINSSPKEFKLLLTCLSNFENINS